MQVYKFSPAKTYLRSRLYDLILKNWKKGNSVFTLPSDNMELENRLYKTFGRELKIYGVEKNPAIYESAKNILPKGMNLFKGKDIQFFETNETKFDFLWLDYCGSFDWDKLEVLGRLAKGENINRKAYLAVTIQAYRDCSSANDYLKSFDEEDHRVTGFFKFLNEEASKVNRHAQPIYVAHYYRYKRGPGTMNFYLIRLGEREKNFKEMPRWKYECLCVHGDRLSTFLNENKPRKLSEL